MTPKTLIVIILCILAGVGICLALGYFGIAPFDSFYSMVAGWFGNFNLSSLLSNPASLLAMAAPAAAVGIGLWSKLSAAKQQAQSTISTAQSQVSSLSGSLSDTTTKLDTANLNLESAQQKITELQATATNATSQLNTLTAERDRLKTELDALNNIQAKAMVLAENKEVVRTVVA